MGNANGPKVSPLQVDCNKHRFQKECENHQEETRVMNHAKQSGYKENDKIPVHFPFCCAGQVLGDDTQHHKLLDKPP